MFGFTSCLDQKEADMGAAERGRGILRQDRRMLRNVRGLTFE
jgi:hypothetical protein